MASESRPPVVDDRTRSDILAELERRSPYYTEEWVPVPGSGDPGWAVAELFSEMVGDVLTRLNRVPNKHRVGFYDALGFGRDPPQSARVPLTVKLDDEATTNISVPTGTRVAAPAADGRPELVFELSPGEGFEATTARLQRLYSVDPTVDGIFEHQSSLTAGRPTQLFVGDSLQRHAFHIGHADLFDLPGGATIRLKLTVSNPAVLDHVRWEYYEERGEEDGDNGPDTHWHRFDDANVTVWSRFNRSVITLTLPPSASEVESESESAFGELTKTTIGGRVSRWIRCVVESGVNPDTFEAFEITDIEIGIDTEPTEPDALISGGIQVPIPTDGSSEAVFPFGQIPQPRDEFYVACRKAFTKRDTSVSIKLAGLVVTGEHPDGVAAALDPPSVAWQYWNGKSWAALPVTAGTSDDVLNLRADGDGQIDLSVPVDLEPTTVAGVEGHWIRAQLQEGRHTQVTYQKKTSPDSSSTSTVPDSELWTLVTEGVGIPSFDKITVEYGSVTESVPDEGARDVVSEIGTDWKQPHALVSLNNLAYRLEPISSGGAEETRIRPFRRLPDENQTVYFGFDGSLVDGPIHLFVSPIDREYPETFAPRLRWEYVTEDDAGMWARATVRDETADLTRRGLVRFVFESPTAARKRFGEDLHWIRARVTNLGDPFDRAAVSATESLSSSRSIREREMHRRRRHPPDSEGAASESTRTCCLDACDGAWRLETEPPGGPPTEAPPTLQRVVPNTGWARNVRTVTEESIGGSDGTPNRRFEVDAPPVLNATVWVDERETITRSEREALTAGDPTQVEVVTAPDGVTKAVWVRWDDVPDFLGSANDDRHYTLDPLVGHVSFGDGLAGMIPPRGAQNVRVTYETGGGASGNVAPDTVSELKSDLPLVASVTNPEAGDGGADAESLDAVLQRAPAELRDRGRAVAKADFERVALAASRKLARARCIPRMDNAADRRLGWVTIVVVPRGDERRPTPSAELQRQVLETLTDRCPATLIAPTQRLVIRGPSYVEVSVSAAVAALENTESVSEVEATLNETISSFLHPLSGGSDGTGWTFGDLPCLSDVFALLEGVDGVDHVEDLTLTYRSVGSGDTIVVDEGETTPSVGPDALVSSGTNSVTVGLASRATTRGGRT